MTRQKKGKKKNGKKKGKREERKEKVSFVLFFFPKCY
jgi:hypothetical protein